MASGGSDDKTVAPTGGSMMTMFWPILLLAIGVVIKLALVDEQLSAQSDKFAFVINRYGPDMWVEILIASWISAANTMASKNLSIATSNGKWLTYLPFSATIGCVVWLGLFAKLGPMGDWTRIWIPLGASLICLVVVTRFAMTAGSKS